MRVVFLSLLVVAAAPAFAQSEGMSLVGQLDPRPGDTYSDIWAYVGSDGREYALMASWQDGGLNVIDVTDSMPVAEAFVPMNGDGSDVEAYGHYAYITSNYSPTLIIDIEDPENPVPVGTFGGDFHTLSIAGGYLYGNGSAGVLIYSLADPENPVFVGQYDPYYVHDVLVRGDTMYTAGIYGEGVDIVDLSDRANPEFIERFNYSGSGAHNVCATESGSYIFVGDEIGTGQWTRVFDVRDPHNVELVAEIIVDANGTVHNCHIVGDLLYLAHYGRGAWVFDVSDPVNPIEVAFYETGMTAAWSFYPHLSSGKLLVSDMSNGLYVLHLDVVVPNEDGPEAPAALALLPASPNPFGTAATLRLTLGSAASHARLTVYDALGRPVAVLHEGPLAAGEHALRFEPKGLPSGVYLARLEADGQIAMQRLTLVR